MKEKRELRFKNEYSWKFQNYLYTPRNELELDVQGNFIEKIRSLPTKYRN
jgi:hypothetical protein